MNLSVSAYFDNIESLLISSGIVSSFRIIRRQVLMTDGKSRAKLTFINGSEAEIFEYIVESNRQILLKKYSFHWQDGDGTLIRRWDNAPHYPNLPDQPHHIHYSDGAVDGVSRIPDTAYILAYIEK